jgi:hypothetical protein
MADFESSSQLSNWMIPSTDAYKERVKKVQKRIMKKIDKYTVPIKKQSESHQDQQVKETPIYTSLPYKYQQALLSFGV